MFFRFTLPNGDTVTVQAATRSEATGILGTELRRLGLDDSLAGTLPADVLDTDAFARAEAEGTVGRLLTTPTGSELPSVVDLPPGEVPPVAQPGPVGGGPGVGGGGADDGTGPGQDAPVTGVLDPEAVSAFGSFREALQGLGISNPDTILGNIAQSRFRPLRDTFAITQLLENTGAAPVEGGGSLIDQLRTESNPGTFADFVRSRGLTGGARDARAGLNLIASGTGADQNSFLAALRSAAPGSDIGGIIQSLAGEALGTTLSPITRSLFGNAAIDLAGRRFESALARGAQTGTAPTFAGFLRDQLRLA